VNHKSSEPWSLTVKDEDFPSIAERHLDWIRNHGAARAGVWHSRLQATVKSKRQQRIRLTLDGNCAIRHRDDIADADGGMAGGSRDWHLYSRSRKQSQRTSRYRVLVQKRSLGRDERTNDDRHQPCARSHNSLRTIRRDAVAARRPKRERQSHARLPFFHVTQHSAAFRNTRR
jgi:hypothetical protein